MQGALQEMAGQAWYRMRGFMPLAFIDMAMLAALRESCMQLLLCSAVGVSCNNSTCK
jgi:hypothetical protein